MKSKIIASTVLAIAALSGASTFAQTNTQTHLSGEAAYAVTFPITPSNLTRAEVTNNIPKTQLYGQAALATSLGGL